MHGPVVSSESMTHWADSLSFVLILGETNSFTALSSVPMAFSLLLGSAGSYAAVKALSSLSEKFSKLDRCPLFASLCEVGRACFALFSQPKLGEEGREQVPYKELTIHRFVGVR